MPGKQVKDWDQYHALRREGHDKESAARITNAIQRRIRQQNHRRE